MLTKAVCELVERLEGKIWLGWTQKNGGFGDSSGFGGLGRFGGFGGFGCGGFGVFDVAKGEFSTSFEAKIREIGGKGAD